MLKLACLLLMCLAGVGLSLAGDPTLSIDELRSITNSIPEDLKWLHALPTSNVQASDPLMVNQKLDVQQTSNVGSYLPGIEDAGVETSKQFVPSINGDLMLMTNDIPIPGKRRLDDDELVLSASKHRERERQYPLMDRDEHLSGREQQRYQEQQRHKNLMMQDNHQSSKRSKTQKAQRRMSDMIGQSRNHIRGDEQISFRQRDRGNYNGKLRSRADKHNAIRRKMVAESREKFSRPSMDRYMSKNGKNQKQESDQTGTDPFFNDEGEAEKRTDADPDEADVDEDNESRDEAENVIPRTRNLKAANSRLRDVRPVSATVRSTEEEADDSESDDEADSSNLTPRKVNKGKASPPLSNKPVQSSTDLATAAGHHHGHHHSHYYQHVEVPKKKAWKFGFKRGNHKHESK